MNPKKTPPDVSEIQFMSKLSPIRIKVAAGSISSLEEQATTDDFLIPLKDILTHFDTNIRITYSDTLWTLPNPLEPKLLFCYQALHAEKDNI